MMSPRRALACALLVGTVVPMVPGVPAVAVPVVPVVAGDLRSAQVQADGLRAEVDALAARARKAADAADRAEERYVALAVRAAAARHALDESNRRAAEVATVGDDRVRALYMSGGQFGAVNTLLHAEGLGDLSSRQQNVSTLVADDTAQTREAKAAADEAAAAKAAVDRLVAEQAAAATAAAHAVESAAEALRTRRDLLQQSDATVAALVAAHTAERAEAAAAAARTAAALATDTGPVTGEWVRPAIGPLSSPFGMRWGRLHAGIDFAARPGSIIRAASSGTVVLASWYGGYGNAVDIDHGNGLSTRYGHASEVLVSTGEYVTVGQPIALVGSTGDSTGPHLHFEVRQNGTPVDPLPFLAARGVEVS